MSTTEPLKTGLRIEGQLVLYGELAMAKAIEKTETIGSRIARLRKDKGMTQTELADALGVSQPVVSDYENDVIGLDSERIRQLVEILSASADEILGLEKLTKREVTVKNRRLYRQLQDIDKLPKRDQEALLRTIDAFLSKAS
jgi:transcriptional regulator with XRE-family HTH domain